jgi:hypothetical protein
MATSKNTNQYAVSRVGKYDKIHDQKLYDNGRTANDRSVGLTNRTQNFELTRLLMYRLNNSDQSTDHNTQKSSTQCDDERISQALKKIQIAVFSDEGLFKRLAQIIPKTHSVGLNSFLSLQTRQ